MTTEHKTLVEDDFKQYRRIQIAEMRPVTADDLSHVGFLGISISEADLKNGSPKLGDMIARNPKNHADKWLVAAAYFSENFEPATALSSRQEGQAQDTLLAEVNPELAGQTALMDNETRAILELISRFDGGKK